MIDHPAGELLLTLASQQCGVDIATIIKVARAKYILRARPGNPKDRAAALSAALQVLGG